jgi:hypothetical protein
MQSRVEPALPGVPRGWMTWPAALLALLVSHLVGDVLVQTEWQAVNKTRGFGDRLSRRALGVHVMAYTLGCVPALFWIGEETTALRAIVVAALIAIPHLLVDDGRLVRVWLREIKRADRPGVGLVIAVDQSLHVVCLLGAALVAAA